VGEVILLDYRGKAGARKVRAKGDNSMMEKVEGKKKTKANLVDLK